MRTNPGVVALLLALAPWPALAGGSGPGVGSPMGIVIIIIALVVGFFLGRFFKK